MSRYSKYRIKFKSFLKVSLFSSISLIIFTFPVGLVGNLIVFRKPFVKLNEYRGHTKCIRFPPDPIFGWKKDINCIDKSSNKLGFTSEFPINKEQTNSLNVLVIGGSVAKDLHINRFDKKPLEFQKILLEAINNELKKRKKLEIKEINIFNAALGGMKQPQGSFTFQALKALGYKFDIVVELSGFNEIAIALQENYIDRGINPIYPRNAHLRFIEASKKLTSNKIQRGAHFILSLHPFHQLITKLGVFGILRREIIEADLRYESKKILGYELLMPKTIDDAFSLSMNIWQSSSENLYNITKNDGAIYILAIQPNQYQKGSKILSSFEKNLIEESQNGTFIYRLFGRKIWSARAGNIIEKYYSKINISSFNIPNQNILDLRNTFISEKNTIYEDACCHMNTYAMKSLAEKIAGRVAILFSDIDTN